MAHPIEEAPVVQGTRSKAKGGGLGGMWDVLRRREGRGVVVLAGDGVLVLAGRGW